MESLGSKKVIWNAKLDLSGSLSLKAEKTGIFFRKALMDHTATLQNIKSKNGIYTKVIPKIEKWSHLEDNKYLPNLFKDVCYSIDFWLGDCGFN